MQYRYLGTHQTNQTLWIMLNNPPVNFLTTELLEELHTLLAEIRKDPGIRVVVLTGAIEDVYITHFSIPELLDLALNIEKLKLNLFMGTRLSAGMVRYFMTISNVLMDVSPAFEKAFLKITKAIRKQVPGGFLWFQMQRVYYSLERLNKLTVAAINGNCNGGGTELSACCDFRFMMGDQGFLLGQPECLVGIVPGGGGSQRLPRLIGKAKALELMLLGKTITAEEAKIAGLITDHFKKEDFRQEIQKFCDAASLRSPVAVDAIKRCVHRGMESTLRHGLSIELEQSVRCMGTQKTRSALSGYKSHIEQHIEVLDSRQSGSRALQDVMLDTKHMLEQAPTFIED